MNKMKRVFSFMLVLSMVLGTLTAFAPQNAFAAEEAKVEETAVVETKVEETKAEEVKKDETKVLKEVPKDVIGTPHEKSIRRLIAFGIVGGYPDGTYKPEEEVTRAQFSKIIVEALGLGDAVPAAQNNKTGFPDVDAYVHWASGYINVASGQGLILGYEDGTFKPEQPVSYAEALTMLVRSLGYEDKFLKGEWPGNYVAKAADVGITKGVQIPANTQTGATRGYVADLVNNTLDAKIVRAKTYTGGNTIVEYETTDITLLKDKLDISKHEDTRIFADKIVNDGLNKDEVSVRFLADTRNKYEVRKEYKENDKADFRTEAGLNLRPFVGEEVTTYLTKNDRVIYIERENDDKAKFDAITSIDGDKVELFDFDKKYAFDKDADVYIYNSKDEKFNEFRGDELDKKAIEDEAIDKRLGKFVVKNNKIVYAEIIESSEAKPWMLVLKNEKGELEGINKETEDFKLNLKKDGKYDYTLAFDTNGNEVKIEDIEKGNVLYIQAQDYDGDDIAVVTVVTDNKLEGKLGKFREDRVEIDGKTVKAIKDNNKTFNSYYTTGTLDDIKVWGNTDWENDFDDADNKEVTVYKDAVGRIAFLTTDVESKSGYKFGVVTRTYADADRVRIYTTIDGKDGKDIVFKAEKERDLAAAKVLDAKGQDTKKTTADILGQAVKFRLNKDNEIVDGEFFVMDKNVVYTMRGDFGKDTMRLSRVEDLNKDINAGVIGAANSFSVKENVSIIDAEGLNNIKNGVNFASTPVRGDIEAEFKPVDIDDFGIANWKDLKSTKENKDLRFYVFPNKGKTEEAEAIVFVGKDGANTGSDKFAAYVTKKERKGDEVLVKYQAYGENGIKEVVADSVVLRDGTVKTVKALGDLDKELPYVMEMRSNGKAKLYLNDSNKGDDQYFTFATGKVTDVTGSKVEIDGKAYTISNSTVVYSEDKEKSISDVRMGDRIAVIIEDEIRVRVIQLDAKGTTTKPEEKLTGIVTAASKEDRIIEVDKKDIFKTNSETRLRDTNGNTIAIGSAIYEEVKVGAQVETNAKTNIIILKAKKADVDQKLADEFKAKHKNVLALEVANVKVEDEAAVKAAQKDFDALDADVQAKLGTEKTKLVNLQAKIDELKEAGKEEAAVKAEAKKVPAKLTFAAGVTINATEVEKEVKKLVDLNVVTVTAVQQASTSKFDVTLTSRVDSTVKEVKVVDTENEVSDNMKMLNEELAKVKDVKLSGDLTTDRSADVKIEVEKVVNLNKVTVEVVAVSTADPFETYEVKLKAGADSVKTEIKATAN